MSPSNYIEANVGDLVEFSCKASKWSTYIPTWIFRGQVGIDLLAHVSKDTKVIIPAVHHKHMGTYTCVGQKTNQLINSRYFFVAKLTLVVYGECLFIWPVRQWLLYFILYVPVLW